MSTTLTNCFLSISLLAADTSFDNNIAPIIVKRCLECHNSRDANGGLDLTTNTAFRVGGDSGAVFDESNPLESYLLQRVESGEMPPPSRGKSQKLPDAEIAALKQWFHSRAPWPQKRVLNIYESTSDVRAGLDWWALQPVRRPNVPKTADSDAVYNPIDAFVTKRLSDAGLIQAPLADRRTLIRRAYFDLIGLPPTAEQIEAFVNNKSKLAYEELIDSLLASKHYGERWARYWLDLVRFAETCGYERDQLKPGIWKYRDWVINALNKDMPYDRFVTLQLAGDEVPDCNEQTVIATGMLRAGTWNDEPNDPADYMYTRLEDMVHTTTSAFLGLTVKCARCHDHKFDPIRQEDYYRTASFFWAGYIGQANQGGPSKEQLGFDVYGWTDKGRTAEPIKLLVKGERRRPGPVVEPAFLSSIPFLNRPFAEPPNESKTTQRRLQFAKWITDPNQPLTPRVFVNRLWQHHFGQAIVRTPNNFGFKSDPPTHPQLLDWLAAEFVAGGWKIKRMHKLIMMSRTYQQASSHPNHNEYAEVDYLNRLWWRFNRRRLDAEALRDSMLAASGSLNLKMGGPSFYPKMSPEALEGLSRKGGAWRTSSATERSRRSIYMMTKRSRLLPLMTTFDFGDTTLPCGQRDVTTVAPQSLAMLNNHFVHEQSSQLAKRVIKPAEQPMEDQIVALWRAALGRSPTTPELDQSLAHIRLQSSHFQSADAKRSSHEPATPADLEILDKLVLWLRADRGVETDENTGVRLWRDHGPTGADHLFPHDASQANVKARPKLISNAIANKPALRFDGKQQFMHLAGQIIWSPQFSIFAVVTHEAKGGAAREIISNWHRRGRSTNSVFLGTRGLAGVRFSDAFANAGTLHNPAQPFILTAINEQYAATTFQNAQQLAASSQLAKRSLAAPYVIGTQGNYQSEWWRGLIAEILVYDRPLDAGERRSVWRYLSQRYEIAIQPPLPPPHERALASLAHVLLNTNEFLYVD